MPAKAFARLCVSISYTMYEVACWLKGVVGMVFTVLVCSFYKKVHYVQYCSVSDLNLMADDHLCHVMK